MGRMNVAFKPQDGEHDCIRLRVTDAETGMELFHAEIWDFNHGNGSGDIDFFIPENTEATLLEWQVGAEILRYTVKSHHIAIDLKSTLPEINT